MNARRLPRIAIYLLDQDQRTTSSLGIFHYSRNLVRGIAEGAYPGFEVVLWVSRANQADFLPPQMPGWMRVVCVDGRFGTGWRRLVADHMVTAWLARKQRPDLIHFPKGFLPAWLPSGIRRVVTIHDAIVSYYHSKYPRFYPRLKIAYFEFLLRRAFRCAEHVITVSDFSAQCLRNEFRDRPSLSVIPSAGFGPPGHTVTKTRNGIFVMGSRLPHKATAETFRRLDAYARDTGFTETITVSGIQRLDDIPGFNPPQHLQIELAGRLSFEALMSRMAGSRALVVLSEIEGFGLPLLESYSVGTPVCFRNVASMREVLGGMPGAWDGASDHSFRVALNECVCMSASTLARIQQHLAVRYDWRTAVKNTLQVYRNEIGCVQSN